MPQAHQFDHLGIIDGQGWGDGWGTIFRVTPFSLGFRLIVRLPPRIFLHPPMKSLDFGRAIRRTIGQKSTPSKRELSPVSILQEVYDADSKVRMRQTALEETHGLVDRKQPFRRCQHPYYDLEKFCSPAPVFQRRDAETAEIPEPKIASLRPSVASAPLR